MSAQAENKLITLENSEFKCKTCSAEFSTLQDCLSHELKHINLMNNKKNNNTPRNKRKRRRTKGSKMIVSNSSDTQFLKECLANCPSGEEIALLCKVFQPPPEELSVLYNNILADLNAELSRSGRQWYIKPFGSTIMGTAFKNSDIDFYIYPHGEMNYKNSDKVYKEAISLFYRSRCFSKIITIPKARVPIIKCKHTKTGYNLDINVSSQFGVNSSLFISHLFCYDSRIHPLLLLIKIWAKNWNLNGTGRVTSYCTALMTIFYLQNCNRPILPSIRDLQKNIPPNVVSGINYAFNKNFKIKGPINKQSISELFKGFFKYYTEFDYTKYIISPYVGKPINRSDFATKKFSFPEYYALLEYLKINYPPTNIKRELHCEPIKIDTLLVIQDPFCLNHNNSASVGKTIFEEFKLHINNANTICNESSSHNSSFSLLLSRLMYENPLVSVTRKAVTRMVPVPPVPALNNDFSTHKDKLFVFKSNSTEVINQKNNEATIPMNKSVAAIFRINPLEVELMFVRSYLRKIFSNQIFTKDEVNEFWTSKIVEYTKDILTNIFEIQITETTSLNVNQNAKVPRANMKQADVHFDGCLLNCELKSKIDTWSNRKNETKKGSSIYLKEQLEITKSFHDTRDENNYPAIFYCRLTITSEDNFSTLVLKLYDLSNNRKSSLKIFFTEFTSRIRYFYKAYFEKLTRT